MSQFGYMCYEYANVCGVRTVKVPTLGARHTRKPMTTAQNVMASGDTLLISVSLKIS